MKSKLTEREKGNHLEICLNRKVTKVNEICSKSFSFKRKVNRSCPKSLTSNKYPSGSRVAMKPKQLRNDQSYNDISVTTLHTNLNNNPIIIPEYVNP